MTAFNEDSRVKIPALLHLARLGYGYLSLKTAQWDARHNLFTDPLTGASNRSALLHILEALTRKGASGTQAAICASTSSENCSKSMASMAGRPPYPGRFRASGV